VAARTESRVFTRLTQVPLDRDAAVAQTGSTVRPQVAPVRVVPLGGPDAGLDTILLLGILPL
jgi:hypothetical protein